ncbi:AraC family transcriptional regulator [Chryseobacterium sp. Marseille-Q3244]|uniref:AraC family transcriptional regulator n=1 Tax=Chryseobacterium sp. Marseille-Q3244 TaxID=2758092 RepID=UPI002023C89C|nr:AraC family transcriptional regulator [Chryseobacterium sp. Marseille-Q3244]
MIKNQKYEQIEAYFLKTDTWSVKSNVSFFQFVYVISGEGIHHHNGNLIPFKEGYLVLLTPDKENYFDLNGMVEFLIMKFHLSYLRDYRWKTINYLEDLLYTADQTSGTIITDEADKVLIAKIVESLILSLDGKKLYYQDLNLHYINSLIVIAARNISEKKPDRFSETTDNKIESILTYIENNIYTPSLLKMEVISKQFGISSNYFSTYFKKQCGENYKDYIANYKLKLIEHRLKFSDKRIGELVEEFGFTDESHINKFYKKYKGITLTCFRKTMINPKNSD